MQPSSDRSLGLLGGRIPNDPIPRTPAEEEALWASLEGYTRTQLMNWFKQLGLDRNTRRYLLRFAAKRGAKKKCNSQSK